MLSSFHFKLLTNPYIERDMFLDDSDTDSDDEDFQAGASDNNARDDTDSLTGKH